MPEKISDAQKSGRSGLESRRSSSSARRLSHARRLAYFLGLPVLRAAIRLLWWTYRVEKVIGADTARDLVADARVCAPCYWHQHHVLCTNMIRGWIHKGFKACFLVSSSVDGDVPARIARAWGAEVIRGSANQTGTLVLRDMRNVLQRGVSIVTTADGPMGPKHEFKAGAALMARISSVPMVPLAAAADRAWYLDRWDDFMIPKPFARVVLGVGEPVSVPSSTPLERIEEFRLHMQEAIMTLMQQCSDSLGEAGSQ